MAAEESSSNVFEFLKEDGTFNKFLEDSFDPRTYANTIIQSRAIGESLAKLANGVSLLDKELHDQVSSHHEDLLSQATGIETLESVLQSIQGRIHSLKSSVERVQVQILEPYNRIASRTAQLRRLQNACDILRRVMRILHLSKRLQVQLKAGVREIAKAAQSINELDHVLEGESLSDIQVIQQDLELISRAKSDVESQANVMLSQGLDSQNQTQTGTALQVFYNLGLLQDRVDEAVSKYSSLLQIFIAETLDPNHISSNQGVSQGPGRVAMPAPGNMAAWRAGLWTRMEKIVNKMYETCERVFHLEKILAKKKDPVSHTCFLESFSENGRSIILNNFWKMAMETLADGIAKAAGESTFIKQAYEGEYPKLLRICNDLWSRLQQFASSVTSTSPLQNNEFIIGITVENETENCPRLMLQESLMPFENAYLSKSLSRLFDPINLVFPNGAQNVPSKDELNSVIKTMASELNVASVDPDLFVLLARNVAKTVQLYVSKCEQLINTSLEASQLSGGLTNGQILNAEVTNSLYQLSSGLIEQVLPTLNEATNAAISAIQLAIKNVTQLMESTLKLLSDAVSRSLENKIAKIHTEDFTSQSVIEEPKDDSDAPCSFYVKDIRSFIQRVQHDYFSLYECKDLLRDQLKPIAARCVKLFVRHVTLLHGISEAGKLKLTSDMAQLELAVTPFCKRISDLGDAYKLLRAFRPLLFQSLDEIRSSAAIGDTLPCTVVLHFLFSKASLELRPPHVILSRALLSGGQGYYSCSSEACQDHKKVAGWTLIEYSLWLDAQPDESEIFNLVESSLSSFKEQKRSRPTREADMVYDVINELLNNARKSQGEV